MTENKKAKYVYMPRQASGDQKRRKAESGQSGQANQRQQNKHSKYIYIPPKEDPPINQ